MPRSTLTDLALKAIQPNPSKQFDVWDAKVPGFGVRVSPSGTIAFQVMYRIGRRPRRFNLGRYPILSLSEARQRARKALNDVTQGKDPASEKVTLLRNPHAFDEFVKAFIETYAKAKNRSWFETERLLQREFVAVWGKRDIRQVKKSDVTAVLDNIVKRGSPSGANHAFAAIRKLFNWAVERDDLEFSPCQGLKSPSSAQSRDRVLSDQELAKVWMAALGTSNFTGNFVQLLILTAQRRTEVASMQWSEIDFDKKVWSLPASKTKNKRAHEVPLTDAAIAILMSIKRTTSDHVFPARGRPNTALSGFNKRKRAIDRLSGVAGWTLHDIRRTVSTGLAGLKVRQEVIERILNHKTGVLSGVSAIYNRFGYLDEMRDALTKWSQHVENSFLG